MLPAANGQSLKPALDIVEQSVIDGAIPGASVLVQNGNTVAARTFGVCDRKEQRAFQIDTICWSASLTKPVTAAATMTLVEQGKLDQVGKGCGRQPSVLGATIRLIVYWYRRRSACAWLSQVYVIP